MGVLLFSRWKYNPENVIKTLVSLAEKAKKDGVYALNEDIPKLDKFLQDGLKMILDGLDATLIRENLQKEIIFTRKAARFIYFTIGRQRHLHGEFHHFFI